MRRVFALGLFGAAMVAGSAALAHGTFIDARPLPGIEVGGIVDEVALLFPEALVADAGSLTVTGPAGVAVPPAGPIEYPVDSVIRLPIAPLAEAGSYRIEFSVPAEDGFIFRGSYEFRYLPEARELDPLPYGRKDWTGWALAVGAVVVAGSVLVVRWASPDSAGDAE